MPQFLVAIHRPDNYDPSIESAAMADDIRAVNLEMVAAGVRVFVGGLQTERNARWLTPRPDGSVSLGEGPYLKAGAHVGGFWVLDVADLDAALEWGRKAAVACRAPVEVRPFHDVPARMRAVPPPEP